MLTGVVVASAKGDVIVDGYVEACQIYAGGSVVMKNGMQGNGKGKIIAGGSVSGKFFERVTIESGMDVHANAIMNSDITAVQDIVVSGKFGIIIGGCIRTQRQVTATIIGNMSEVKTILQVGSDVDLYATLLANEKDQKDLKKEYDKINAVMKKVDEALAIMKFTPKASSPILEKLLKSAIANAENNNGMSVENLYVEECYANKGPTMKRIRPRAQGRAYRIEKRMSHITLVLNER